MSEIDSENLSEKGKLVELVSVNYHVGSVDWANPGLRPRFFGAFGSPTQWVRSARYAVVFVVGHARGAETGSRSVRSAVCWDEAGARLTLLSTVGYRV